MRAKNRAVLKELIYQSWESSKHRYGARRIRADLAEVGHHPSLWLVGKLMRELGIAGVQPRSSKRTTIPAADAQQRRDLVRRQWDSPVATTVLVGDITYIKTLQGWLYLATVIDVTTRMVVGWQIAEHMRTSLIIDALKSAHQSGFVAGGAIFHSDRGSVYTSAAFKDYADSIDVRLSTGRTGVCWDNALAESFFSMLKNEWYYQQPLTTKKRCRAQIMDYIEVDYNRRRRHSTLNYQTPWQRMSNFLNHPLLLQAAA